MILGRVLGAVVATIKDPHLQGHKLLLVQPLGAGARPDGAPVVAVDLVGAGPGDGVLVVQEGGSARLVLGCETTPVEAVVVGQVDRVDEDHG
jgi:ethanolamine utilization protein EutN